MDFLSLRKEYENRLLKIDELADDPLVQFKDWCADAEHHCPGKWFEPNGMALATTDLEGNVTVRWVLLKGILETGIQFFTNYESVKGQQLAINPKAAVAIHWPYLGRQVRLEGDTERTSRAVSLEYFHSRPRGSQLGAFASRQSTPLDSRESLDSKVKQLEQEFANQPVPLPENWGGYVLTPRRVEFWQGRVDRLHDRICYTRAAGIWKRFRLSP